MVIQQVESKAKLIFTYFKGGYTQVLNLLSQLELLQFLLKYKLIDPAAPNKIHVYLAMCEQLLKILEDEVEKAENRAENLASFA